MCYKTTNCGLGYFSFCNFPLLKCVAKHQIISRNILVVSKQNNVPNNIQGHGGKLFKSYKDIYNTQHIVS